MQLEIETEQNILSPDSDDSALQQFRNLITVTRLLTLASHLNNTV